MLSERFQRTFDTNKAKLKEVLTFLETIEQGDFDDILFTEKDYIMYRDYLNDVKSMFIQEIKNRNN